MNTAFTHRRARPLHPGGQKARRRPEAAPGGEKPWNAVFAADTANLAAAAAAAAEAHGNGGAVAVMVVVPADGNHATTPDRVAMAIVVGNVALHVRGATTRAVVLYIDPRGTVVVTCLGVRSSEETSDAQGENGDQLFHDVVLGFTNSDEGFAGLFKMPENSYAALFQTFPPFPMARRPRE